MPAYPEFIIHYSFKILSHLKKNLVTLKLSIGGSTSIIRGHLCVIPSFVGHHHNFPRVVVVIETMMNVFILTKLSSARLDFPIFPTD